MRPVGRGAPRLGETKTKKQTQPAIRILVPVRYSAWLSGDLGKQMTRHFSELRVTRMPRGFLVEGATPLRALVERVVGATAAIEAHVKQTYPVFHTEMGPVWTGTLQVILPKVDA